MAESNGIPKTVNMTTQCPFCGEVFEYPMYPEIVIPGDHKLKKKILNKSLFFPTCPRCKETSKLKPRCLYRNETKKEMFVVTDEQGDTEFEVLLKSGNIHFNDIHTDDDIVDFMKGMYKRRVVRNVDSFREKILLSDNNYDDRIIELMKLSLSGLIEKENGEPVYRIFLEDTAGSRMMFTAILGSHAPYEYVTIETAANVYNQYRDKYLHRLGRPEEDEYIATDQKWARKSGLLKDEDAGMIIPT
ncbi:MAG: CpXC domain-containing protein [Lachnospiraceae bacterium]|nr:CpXC domain-containing protein [Lachnospiraceae bacterium]